MVAVHCDLGREYARVGLLLPSTRVAGSSPPCNAAQPADRPAVLHSLLTPNSVLPLDNALQPAADDTSDPEHREVEWEIVDDDFAV